MDIKAIKQYSPSSPFYLAGKFENWTERTGIMDGSGLSWVGAIPASIVVLLISLCYWIIKRRRR